MPKKRRKKSEESKKAIWETPVPEIKKMDKQVKYIIIVMIVLLLIALGAYYFVQSSKKFYYGGLDFQKEMFGKIVVYHTVIPVSTSQGELVANYNLFLRNDPRDLENIKVDGKIMLMTNTLVSIEPEANTGCEDSGIAGGNFFNFLKIAGVNARIAYTNETYALKTNTTYATCANHNNNTGVIVIKMGENTEIVKKSDDCYEISFSNCGILNATERFLVAAFAHSKNLEV